MPPETQTTQDQHIARARTLGRVGAAMLLLGILISLGLTFITTLAWGFSASALRSERNAGTPDDQLAALSARTDFLADASLWIALGAVPLGLIMVIAGLAIRGRSNQALRRASKPR